MRTLLLDRTVWDLCKTAGGDIAVADDPYSMAQDVASECRLFKGELWYDTTRGVLYWQRILGQLPPVPLLKAQWVAAAKLVPGVVAARAFVASLDDRGLTGQVQAADRNGALPVVTI